MIDLLTNYKFVESSESFLYFSRRYGPSIPHSQSATWLFMIFYFFFFFFSRIRKQANKRVRATVDLWQLAILRPITREARGTRVSCS